MEKPIDIELELLFGECNGYMNLAIYKDRELITNLINIDQTRQTIDFRTTLPAQLKFITSNKNMNFDTKLDQNGHIVQDKFIELTGLCVGKMPVHALALKKLCSFVSEHNQTFYDTFWHTNGSATIKFDTSSIISWHLQNIYTQNEIITQ